MNPRFRMTELPRFSVTELNDQGRVGGSVNRARARAKGSEVNSSDSRAAFWEGGTLKVCDVPVSGVHAINNRGVMLCVGGAQAVAPGDKPLPYPDNFLWDGGTVTPLPGRIVNDLNDAGVQVGVTSAGEDGKPCRWTNGVCTVLPLPRPALGGAVMYINNRGEVAGQLHRQTLKQRLEGKTYAQRAVLWRRDVATELPVPPGNWELSYPTGLAEDGTVCGCVEAPGGTARAVVWRNAIVSVLTAPGNDLTLAGGVNANGTVIGVYRASRGERACLWQDGKFFDLGACVENASGREFTFVSAINRRGQIVCRWRDTKRSGTALLTPV
jgi:probable HAF family extracellular repeat protein